MKNFKYILSIFTGVLILSCTYDLDPINSVEPGADSEAPVVTINYPTEGTFVRVPDELATITIKFETTDDIELKEVDVSIDGTSIANYNTFTDYRRFLKEIVYDEVTNGKHELTVTVSDLSGKSTTESVSFRKASPYDPKYTGEEVYFPFDGDLIELVTTSYPTEVGKVGFLGKGKVGDNSLKATADSYITVPSTPFTSTAGFSASMWVNINSSPDRAGLVTTDFGESKSRIIGFRFFRENAGDNQRFKLNVGNGTKEYWVDGGTAADVAPDTGAWTHLGFTISETQAIVYINGVAVKTVDIEGPVDWTGVENIVIGAGGPSFSYWGHKTEQSGIDEVRLFSAALSASEMQTVMGDQGAPSYFPEMESEVLYMPFEGDYIDQVGAASAASVGDTGFGEPYAGSQSFKGATDSYLTYPISGFKNDEFSAAFWYKVNPDPTRSGILTVGDDADDRKQGFRLFREGDETSQRIKLNVGTGEGESWNDGEVIDATAGEWVHIAITVSSSQNTIYINGKAVRSSDLASPIDWTGCTDLVIGSGGPTFSYWDHKSDLSEMDELRFFNKALTSDEIATVMDY